MNSAQLMLDRAVELHQQGKLEQAMELYKGFLEQDPDHAGALFMLGNAIAQSGQFESAKSIISRAVEIDATHPDWFNNLGIVHHECGNRQAAIDALHHAIDLDSTHVMSLTRLGKIYQEQGEIEKAREALSKAIKANRGYIPALIQIAILEDTQQNIAQAIAYLVDAYEIDPSQAEINLNLGNLYRKAGDLVKAQIHLQKLMSCSDKYQAMGLTNLGLVALEAGDFTQALRYYDLALTIDKACHLARWNKSLLFLLLGKLKKGWLLYDTGFLIRQRPQLGLPLTRWQGEQDIGKLLVWMEQGLGDEIMHASCLDEISLASNCFAVYCDERLQSLFQGSFPEVRFITKQSAEKKGVEAGFTHQICSGSLPGLFRNSLEDFPRRPRYLKPKIEQVEQWRNLLHQLPGEFNIGFSWRGGRLYQDQRKRSIDLVEWMPLFNIGNVNFINLQHGDVMDELDPLMHQGLPLHHFGDLDFGGNIESVAALHASMDLVITVDNTNAHLAGATGTPTWVLLPYIPDWRWMLYRDTSPWYPAVKLYRQTTVGDWGTVIARVNSSLNEWYAAGNTNYRYL